MIDQPASHQQLDLLVLMVNGLDPRRLPQATRAEVTALLKLLMAEHVAEELALPCETADE
jgi:hypothetical protein